MRNEIPNSSSVEGKLCFIKNLQVNKIHIKEECSWSPTAEATAEDLHGACADDRKQTNCASRINRKVSDTSDPTRPQFKPGLEEIRGCVDSDISDSEAEGGMAGMSGAGVDGLRALLNTGFNSPSSGECDKMSTEIKTPVSRFDSSVDWKGRGEGGGRGKGERKDTIDSGIREV